MKQLKKVVVTILLFIFILSSPVRSGTTGKITGIITDKATEEPLMGAAIVVVDTKLGAVSDLNGQYTILDVPPGIYTLQISFVGFRNTTVKEVRVNIDQTTRIDVNLESTAIQLGEMTILAQRPIIKEDVATSVVNVTDKEVKELPITSVVSAVGLQAGIRGGWGGSPGYASQPTFVSNYTRGKVSVGGGISIRGGDGDNILFQVDGVTLRDPRNNEPVTQVALSSVKEISVERGGFNAEYGQVRSGIVNVVTREGSKQGYYGNFQVRMSPPAAKYYKGDGILDVTDPYSFALRPFFDPDVCWTGTGNGKWDEYTRKQYPEFMGWNEISRILCTDNDPDNDLTPLGAQRVFEYETRKKQSNNKPDYDIDAGFGGPIPVVGSYLGDLRFFTSYRSNRDMLLFPVTREDYHDYNWTMQLVSDITPSMKLRLSSLIGKQYTIRHNWDATGIYFYPHYSTEIAGIISYISSTADLGGIFSDYNFCLSDIGQRSFAGRLTHTLNSSTFYEISVETFRRDYYTRPAAVRDTSAKYEVIPGFYEDSNPFGYWPYDSYGVILTGGQHFARARDNTVVNSTTIKADFTSQLNFHNLVKTGVEFNYNDLDFDYGTIASGGQAAEKYANRVQMHVFPYRAAAYIQDKLETKGFTMNAGLRLDYSNSNSNWWALDPFYAAFFSSNYNASKTFITEDSKSQWQLSPRLGVAHPITENSKLFFNYGHFRQVPQYESLFRIERTSTQSMSSYGNPNLILSKTISYELGFDYIFAEGLLLQAAAFYNDITDQQDFTQYISSASGFSYTATSANNYQDTRGFEVTLRKTSGGWFSGFINYTYQVNTTGHFGSSRVYDNPSDQKRWDEATVNLYQDRPIPQPYARANLSFFTPDDFGPELLGHKILGGFLLNIVLDWQDGYWTTWNPKGLPSVAYNVQAVDYFGANLRFQKNVNIGKFNFGLFMDVSNLFNTLRLWNTGDQEYMESLHLPKSSQYDNIPGDDKVGDYREPGVEFQPMEYQNQIDITKTGKTRPVYYEGKTGAYWQYIDNKNIPVSERWVKVDQSKIDQINKDKAYIDMPNASTYWFLDPRKIYFGVRVSFNFTD